MMLKRKGGWKRGQYDVQTKRVDGQGWALCGNHKVDAKGGIMMCKLKGQMEKEGYYNLEIKYGFNRGQYSGQINRADG